MPCTRCGCDFGLFKKEHSCKSCGFAFCGSCLSKKAKVPNKGDGKPVSVCNKCYQFIEKKASNPGAESTDISPPAALARRMEELEKKGASGKCKVNMLDSHKPNNIDLEISKRLENLRGNQPPAPPVEEIQNRLANLKGVDPNVYWNRTPDKVFKTTIPITSTEESQRLMDRYNAEVEMEKSLPNPDEEIAARLSKLRSDDGAPVTPKKNTKELDASNFLSKMIPPPPTGEMADMPDEGEMRTVMGEARAMLNSVRSKSKPEKVNVNADREDEDVGAAEEIVDKAMAKARLRERTRERASSTESDESTELPWCEICNCDAQLRCLDCDSDLYCNRCFKECHDEFDIKHHKVIPYNRPAKSRDAH